MLGECGHLTLLKCNQNRPQTHFKLNSDMSSTSYVSNSMNFESVGAKIGSAGSYICVVERPCYNLLFCCPRPPMHVEQSQFVNSTEY